MGATGPAGVRWGPPAERSRRAARTRVRGDASTRRGTRRGGRVDGVTRRPLSCCRPVADCAGGPASSPAVHLRLVSPIWGIDPIPGGGPASRLALHHHNGVATADDPRLPRRGRQDHGPRGPSIRFVPQGPPRPPSPRAPSVIPGAAAPVRSRPRLRVAATPMPSRPRLRSPRRLCPLGPGFGRRDAYAPLGPGSGRRDACCPLGHRFGRPRL